jgi:hypothetical protein
LDVSVQLGGFRIGSGASAAEKEKYLEAYPGFRAQTTARSTRGYFLSPLRGWVAFGAGETECAGFLAG